MTQLRRPAEKLETWTALDTGRNNISKKVLPRSQHQQFVRTIRSANIYIYSSYLICLNKERTAKN